MDKDNINYYWVNQGSHFKDEVIDGILCSPQKDIQGRDIYKLMRYLHTGDIIINYKKPDIVAFSKVIQNTYINENGDYEVKVKYNLLDKPIKKEEFKKRLGSIEKVKQILSNINNTPFDKNFNINLGYLFNINKEIFDLIFNNNPILSLKWWEIAAIAMYNEDPNREYKPAEVLKLEFVKKAMDIKDVKNPSIATELRECSDDLSSKYNRKTRNYFLRNDEFYKLSEAGIKYIEINLQSFINEKNKDFHDVKNQILYGPPGTGKTYKMRQYIENILGSNPGLKINSEEQKLNDIVKDLSWYTAIAVSMYLNGKQNKYKVSDLMQQKIIKAFALTRENKNLRAALWAQMQIHTSEDCKTVNYTNRQAPFIFEKNENSEWYLTEDGIKFVEENLADQIEQYKAPNNTRKIEDFYKFITFHQSYSYEEFVEGIKPKINAEEDNSQISYEYNKGIFKEICQQANSDPNNKYLLIIDEINRGNISKIFGELITLIEKDKRVTPNKERNFENTKINKEQLLVTLPYTKSKFGVPSNLYIIGTMNTSDRSIASIDIALRRRFKFIEMMPKPEKLVNENNQPQMVEDINLQNLLKTINERISYLLDRDHQIGHSYFMNWEKYDMETLKDVWFDEIIPLLNEYFYSDWDKLQAILGGKNDNDKDDKKFFIIKLKKPDLAYNVDCSDEEFYYNFVKKEDVNETDFRTMLKNAKLIESKSNETSNAN